MLPQNAKATLPSELVEPKIANQFFSRTMEKLNESGVKSFGVRIDGTADYPCKLHDADYPLVLLYFQGFWDLAHTKSMRRPLPKAAKLSPSSALHFLITTRKKMRSFKKRSPRNFFLSAKFQSSDMNKMVPNLTAFISLSATKQCPHFQTPQS